SPRSASTRWSPRATRRARSRSGSAGRRRGFRCSTSSRARGRRSPARRIGAYGRAIRAAAPHVDVVEVAAPALVPLVERGAADEPEARDAVRDAVSAIPGAYDALVYGCTHYPMLDRRFAEALPPRVERIDPARSQAAATRALIGRLALPAGARRTTYYTNGDVDAFTGALRRWNG